MQIPNSLRETVEGVHGESGRQWLLKMPALVDEFRQLWSLELDQPFKDLSYNLVIPGRKSDGVEVVLKLGVPCPELLTEAAALQLFDGEGAVRLLEHDASRGVLLIERVTPGVAVHKVQNDEQATQTVAGLMRRLWHDPPTEHSFPTLAVWFRAFEWLRDRFAGGTGPFPEDLVARAERTATELQAATEGSMILHGDLHHANVLYSETRGWLAIDPKGVCGDPGYEVGCFMLNQLPAEASESATVDILSRRLSIFADELQIERARLAKWAFCHAVLSAVWSFQDSADWQDIIRLARILVRA